MTFVGGVHSPCQGLTPDLLQTCHLRVLPCGCSLFFVVADLNGAKDTVRSAKDF